MSTIRAINARNATIRSVYYPEMKLKVKKDVSVSLDATMAYEKEKRFRMICSSFFGKETDIGSNDEKFWFWSKRMDPPILYYAKHEDTHKSRLRKPFHPTWMRETVGVDEINTEKVYIEQDGDKWKIFQERISINGRPIVHMTLIDNEKTLGRYLYTPNGDLVISAEIKAFYHKQGHIVPKLVHIYWAEEDVAIQWVLDRPQVNTSINLRMWKMPNMRRSRDLGNQKFWCELQDY